eukprot:11163505-Lingulodinium_polyedra.AAC.1
MEPFMFHRILVVCIVFLWGGLQVGTWAGKGGEAHQCCAGPQCAQGVPAGEVLQRDSPEAAVGHYQDCGRPLHGPRAEHHCSQQVHHQ